MRHALRQALVLARVAARLAGGFLSLASAGALLPRRWRASMIQRWCRGALEDLGIALRVEGSPLPSHVCLVVANHVSWVDTIALGAVLPCGFVAKEALRRWPLVGRLIALSGGVFVHRERPAALPGALSRLEARLQAGKWVCVFPEATNTTGESVAPFFGAAFESSVRTGVPVLPVALRYRADGRPTPLAAWVGDEAFLPSLLRIGGARGLGVEVIVGEPMAAAPCRSAAAGRAREAVAALACLALAGSPFSRPGGGRVPLAAHSVAVLDAVCAALHDAIAQRAPPPLGTPGADTPLAALGVDSLEIVALLAQLQARAGVDLDTDAVELPLDPTVGELRAAVMRCARPRQTLDGLRVAVT
ncbi:MAG: 1-acyl-sn-glycerol-3-phosphate acyltransferase [Betaproteobacteria bacterium]